MSGPRIVVVDLGPDPTTDIVGKMLDSIANARRPIAVGLDLIFVKDLQENRSKGGDNPVDKLVVKLEDAKLRNTLIAMDMRSNQQLKNKLGKLAEIRPASVELRRDEDGVVRSVCPKEAPGERTPTLAEVMLDERGTSCGPNQDPPIFFAPIGVAQADGKRGVFLVAWETVERHPEILNDSYVLLGSAARGVGSDRFFTPAGELPGVMIHAQSLWTLWRNNESLWGWHHEGLVSLLDLAVAFLAGAVFSLYLACRDSRMRLDSIRQALRQFAEGLVMLVLMVGFLVCFGVGWTWLAASVGMAIGAVSAMFGAMLEALVHAGEFVVKPLHWLVEQRMKRKRATVA